MREKQYLIEDTVQSKRLKYMKINNATNSQINQSKKYIYYETWAGKNENKSTFLKLRM